MGRNKSGWKRKPPAYIQLPYKVVNSEAYKELKHAARGILPQMYGKARYRHDDPNIYERVFEFSYREAKRFKYSSSTYYEAMSDMRKRGFIDKVRQGGSHGEHKATNLYRLSRRWELFGTDEFLESDQKALNEYTQKHEGIG